MQEFTLRVANLANYDNGDDRNLVTKAAHFAETCHRGFFRLDKTPYILHPFAVATILSEWKAPPPILAAALLHDVFKKRYSRLSSSAALKAELEAEFPASLLSLVRDVALLGEFGPSLIQKPVEVSVEQDQETHIEGRRSFSWAYRILEKDPMAVVIKLADRLH